MGCRKAVGFYWTLPVPWAGFTALPEDIDAAARASRTIRYQRDAIRRHAAENRYDLIAEKVFLEIAPDRGSEYIREPLAEAGQICRDNDAVLLFVDFSFVQGWRSHHAMDDWALNAGLDVCPVTPDPIMMDGQSFEPDAHFVAWRKRQSEWRANKAQRVEVAFAEARKLLEDGASHHAIADSLNERQIRSATGKLWTRDNVAKLLAQPAADGKSVK